MYILGHYALRAVISFADPVRTSLSAVWAEQHEKVNLIMAALDQPVKFSFSEKATKIKKNLPVL